MVPCNSVRTSDSFVEFCLLLSKWMIYLEKKTNSYPYSQTVFKKYMEGLGALSSFDIDNFLSNCSKYWHSS